jgi:hypothetical protein
MQPGRRRRPGQSRPRQSRHHHYDGKPTRQDLTNRVSLSGKVTISPVFGLVAPVAGQVRFLNVNAPTSTPTRPTRVANVVANGRSHPVEVPAGATFSGRLVDDRSTVTAGMPIVSARYAGYGDRRRHRRRAGVRDRRLARFRAGADQQRTGSGSSGLSGCGPASGSISAASRRCRRSSC